MRYIYFIIFFLNFVSYSQTTYSLQYAKAIENEASSNVAEHSYILHGSKDLFYYRDNQIIILDLGTFTETVFATIGTNASTDIMQIYIDANGNVYAGGYTTENENFTTEGVYMPTYDSSEEIYYFVAKYDSEGTLVARSYMKHYGVGGLAKKPLAVDGDGNIYLVDYLHYTETIPDAPFQSSVTIAEGTFFDGYAPVLHKLNSNLQLIWKTFFAHHHTGITHINTLDNNQLVVYGYAWKNPEYDITLPNFFSTPGSFIENNSSFGMKGFINVFNTNGTRAWGTYLNNNSSIFVRDCKTFGNDIYIINSKTFEPTPETIFQEQKTNMLSKFDANGNRVWSTYTTTENFQIDSSGKIYLYGSINTNSLSTTENCFQDQLSPPMPNIGYNYTDGYHQIISNDATQLLYSTYYGNYGSDRTIKIFPQTSGYYSLESVGNYNNSNDFITDGSPLTQDGAFYKGRVLSLFGQTASNTKQELENLSVYPNPVEDQLIIENEFAFKDSDQVKVYNILGQNIKFDKQIDNQYIYINTTSWSSGMYLIEVLVDGKKGSYKVIKK